LHASFEATNRSDIATDALPRSFSSAQGKIERWQRSPRQHFKSGASLYVVKETDTRALADVPFLYGSRPPPNDSVWQRIRDDGFDVKVFDRNIRNKEKGVDMEMGMDIAERLYTVLPPRTIVIAAGDADYVPAVSRAQSKGWKVEVWFWSNAAEQLKSAADRFCPLDKYSDYLHLGGGVALPP
jgi:uncharacterized LabA/DUF88 family protein